MKKNNLKILIIGSKGNLGSRLIKIFKNNEVIGLDRGEIDITDKNNLMANIKKIKPNIVINTSAYNAVDICEEDEEEFNLAKKINCEAIESLSEICAQNNILLVHYSSDYVFDGQNPNGYNENSKPNPINNYGLSKFLGEKNISCPKYYLIRTSKLFGPQGSSSLAKPSFFDIMLKLANEKKEIKVINEEKSCFTYTPDLAIATKKLIEEEKPSGIYHLVNSGPVTWYEACLELFKIAGIKTPVIPIKSADLPRPAKRPKYSILISAKLPPLRNYQEALKEYLSKK